MAAGLLMSLIPGTGKIIDEDIWNTIVEVMNGTKDELGLGLQKLVENRTPYLTGALRQSILYETGSAKDTSQPLITVYADDADQIASWGRVYVAYQEGPPQGLSTYTNPPRQMFQITADTDGFALVETWAISDVDAALALVAAGTGSVVVGVHSV